MIVEAGMAHRANSPRPAPGIVDWATYTHGAALGSHDETRVCGGGGGTGVIRGGERILVSVTDR